jgi:hypothetical protein
VLSVIVPEMVPLMLLGPFNILLTSELLTPLLQAKKNDAAIVAAATDSNSFFIIVCLVNLKGKE